jgi:glucosyl-dolichyl phosphate glucuronosyltransferase
VSFPINGAATLAAGGATGADCAYAAAAVRLSAIVPTHNRPNQLRACLETLRVQDVDPGEFEVIVVDDGSPTEMAALVAEAAASGDTEMRCERLTPVGLNGARNHGASVARGAVLAFLDDDTLVSPGWARALIRAFAEYPCAAAGGRVKLRLDGPEPWWLETRRCYLAEYDLGAEPFWIESDDIDGRDAMPVGANCAVRRSDFDRLGGFIVGLDRIGRSLVSNGDTEFFHRLRAAGGSMRYVPEASVLHCVPADRLTVDFFTRRYYAQGVSDELLRTLEGGDSGLAHRWELTRNLGSCARMFSSDALRRRRRIDGRFLVSYWTGRLVASGKRPALATNRRGAGAESLPQAQR